MVLVANMARDNLTKIFTERTLQQIMSNQLSDSELKDTKFEAEVISKDSNSQVKVTNRESTVTVTFAPDCNKRFENLAKVGANLKFYNLEKKSAQELIFTNGSYLLAIPPMSAFPPKKTITSKEVMKRGESPPRDSCHSDEIDKLYDEWATEKTMQLLSGELGGPNLLQNLFGRTRDGALIEEKKSSLQRTRGGATGDDSNIGQSTQSVSPAKSTEQCKVCHWEGKSLMAHLRNRSLRCSDAYDMMAEREKRAKKTNAAKCKTSREKKKAENPEKLHADEAKRKGKSRTAHAQSERESREKKKAENPEKFRTDHARSERESREKKKEENPEKLHADEAAKQQNCRKIKIETHYDMIRQFWDDVEPGWSFACICCHRKRFSNQVAVYNPGEIIKNVGENIIDDAIGDLDPDMKTNGEYHLCHYCRKKILKDQVPPMSHKNCLDLVDLEPHPELKLTPLENSLIAKNLIFQKLVQLPKSRWSATKDKIVNVPIFDRDIADTMERLPRTPDEAQLVCIELKRKLEYKNTHNTEYISVAKVEKALDTLYDLGHPHYQFVGDMAGFEERCKKEERLLRFDRLSDFSFKKTPAKEAPKKCEEKPMLDFERFFKRLREVPQWPFRFQFCINPYSFYFWGCRLETTFFESEEFRSWPEAVQEVARDPWFIYIAKKDRMFWQGQPKRIYEAALSNGWKGAKLGKSESWEEGEIGPTLAVINPNFTPNYTVQSIPKPSNWYRRRTVFRNQAKKVGRRRASIGTLSKAMPLEIVECLPLSWQKAKPWRSFNPTTATGCL